MLFAEYRTMTHMILASTLNAHNHHQGRYLGWYPTTHLALPKNHGTPDRIFRNHRHPGPYALLEACAALFSANYGVWGGVYPGKRVKVSAARLRAQSLSVPAQTVLVTCKMDDRLVGHAFATVWSYDGGKVAWVMQLVVDQSVRRRYIATLLLQTLKLHKLFRDITAIGLASSHPASVNVLAKYAHVRLEDIDTKFIAENSARILKDTPIDYLKPENVPLRGSLFERDTNCASGAVSFALTNFYINHAEPLVAWDQFKRSKRWCLGELLEGHEFLVPVVVDYFSSHR